MSEYNKPEWTEIKISELLKYQAEIAALTEELEQTHDLWNKDSAWWVKETQRLDAVINEQTATIAALTEEIERLKTALSGRTYFHSDAQVEAELAQLEATCAALEKRYSELYAHHIAEKHEGELAETEQLQADCRLMATAVLRAHNLVTHNSGHMPCTCDACGVARRYA